MAINITRTACNTYSVENKEAVNVDIVVYQMEDDYTWSTAVQTVSNVAVDATEDVVLTEDGVYRFITHDVATSPLTPLSDNTVIGYCGIESCYLALVKNILETCSCNDCVGSTNQRRLYLLNAFMVLAYTFFMYINGLHVNNWLYDILDTDEQEDLNKISDILGKLQTICDCLNLDSDCGCS